MLKLSAKKNASRGFEIAALAVIIIYAALPALAAADVVIDPPLTCRTIECIIGKITALLAKVAPPIAILLIVVGAFQMLLSGGNPEKITAGRRTIVSTVIGLIVLFFAAGASSLIGEILNLPPGGVTTTAQVLTVIANITQFIFGLFLGMGVLMIVVAAIMYATAAGNTERIDRSKKTLTYAVVALVIALLASSAPTLLESLFGVTLSEGFTSQSQLFTMLSNLVEWLYGAFLGLAVVMIFWAGFLFLTAGDSKEQVGNAKKTLVYAAVAVAVAFFAASVQPIVRSILGS